MALCSRRQDPDKRRDGLVRSEDPATQQLEETHNYAQGLQLLLICISLCLCVFLVGLDATILTTAIPSITDEFGSVDDVGWYDAAFRLTSCMSQLSQGKLYDNYAIKWVFLVNMVIFEAGILVSGVASSSLVFIIGRAITGLGFSGISQGCMVIVAMSTPLQKRAAYLGVISASEYTAMATAPIIGGALTSALSWRWCFYINLPTAAAPAAMLLLLTLPQMPSGPRKSQIERLRELDLLGCFFFAPAILCLLLALQWGGETYSWNSARIIALLVLAPIAFAVFCFIQHWKQDSAMLPPRILKQRVILAGALFSLSLSACRAIVQYYLAIWFQTVRGATALQSGIYTLPLVIAVLVSAMAAGRFMSMTGIYTPIMIPAGLLVVGGVAMMTRFSPTTPTGLWIASLILLGIGSGSSVSIPFIAAQAVLGLGDLSAGMALMTFSQDLGEAVFISIAQAVFLTRLTGALQATAPDLDPQRVIHLGATDLQGKVPAQDVAAVALSYDLAVRSTFYLAVALAGLLVLAAVPLQMTTLMGGRRSSS
ncbi:MFS general substrate transporter [Aspergillus japonicus CBS 114.51]|uniref:MFS general substrate transporter n=1 Tax=Aspergillus japonicus CBS 114.51 TaxID=1448312 RepID=A0A8T8X0C8_ASPJA|nr:MFS general substrate transporter [Aspergillus japonicus CBS 114.51]RAH81009.1 MFS general substrate transporter [Aspergillus japonicus CBS 114.51]